MLFHYVRQTLFTAFLFVFNSWTTSDICFSYKSIFSLPLLCVYLCKHAVVCVRMSLNVYEWQKGTDRMQRRDEVIHLNELKSTVTSRCWLRFVLIDPKWDGSQERPCLPCRCYIQLCHSKQAVCAACVHQPGTKAVVSSFPPRES